MPLIAIRKEDKSRFERRAAVSPEMVRKAAEEYGVSFVVEPSPVRVFGDGEYEAAGATLSPDFGAADIVLGVKEIPIGKLEPGKAYLYFSHTIKGQAHNMPMLRKLMDLGCTLLDYEKIEDAQNRRLVFFGYHAGLAGMIDGLWILGRRLADAGLETPLAAIRQAFEYEDLAGACDAIRRAGEEVARGGLPEGLPPFVVGFAGYGNVSRGAQYVFDHLPFEEVSPEGLADLFAPGATVRRDCFYKVVFKEEHMGSTLDGSPFVLQDYYSHPERFEGRFEEWLPYLSMLVNCIYWEPRYPRLVTRRKVQEMAAAGTLRLQVISDITCDIDGSIEMTVEATDQVRPILLYDPATDRVERTVEGPGLAVLAVDNLPCELSKDATLHFSKSLFPFLAELANLDRSAPFDALELAPELKKAVIVWNGRLTPSYEYLERELQS